MQPKSAIDLDISKDTSWIARNFMKIQFNGRYFGSDEQVANSLQEICKWLSFLVLQQKKFVFFCSLRTSSFFYLACRAESQKSVARKKDVTC